jgi:protein SCO1/2
MRYFLLILFLILLVSACQKSQPQTLMASPAAKRFTLHGKVVAVDKAKKKATISHEAIPDYMDAMTMDFPVKDDFVLNDLTKDADISASLVVDKDAYWLENFVVSTALNPNQPALPPINENFVQIGSVVPDFALTNQDGKQISMKNFRGRALAVTFIYTRCPLPEYCILMSRNFSDLANQLQNSPESRDKIRLLTISFDPQTDTPQKLREYGLGYLGKGAKPDFTVWQLATASNAQVKTIADFFGLRYETDEVDRTQFKHSLRTVVIAPDGKVRKIFSGSDWTIDELLREMKTTLE